jgi:hypothetical protein
MPLPVPWELPEDTPFPSDILPFQPFLPPLTRNPFPDRPECVKEWADAEQYCRELDRNNRLGKPPYKGHGPTVGDCVRGQVSADCGGNPVKWV